MSEKEVRYPKLGAAKADRATAVARATANLVPWAGGALAELVNEFIPNQRLDRIEKFLMALKEELELRGLLNSDLNTPSNADLVEEGGRHATRATSDERIRYLARCVAEGISIEDQEKLDERRILAILSEIDDRELLILEAHLDRSSAELSELKPRKTIVKAPDELRVAEELFEASISRLEILKLLDYRILMDRETNLPRFDHYTGRPEGYHRVTALGERVLRRVGLLLDPPTRGSDAAL
jgi:hypothetical protein